MNIIGKNIFQKLVILLLFSGGFACSQTLDSTVEINNLAKRPTVTSDSLEIKSYSNGQLSYKFSTPLFEHYQLAENPYKIFTKGIHIESYDSLGNVNSMLDALYAHHDETKKLWEAKGNVVARDSSGKILYTQQIYWDENKKIYYSNVDTKVVDGDEITVGAGFESDDKLQNIQFKQNKGRILIDTTKTQPSDSLAISTDTTKTTKK